MLRAEGATLATRFIRGNQWAEFTAGHEAHGDTEFKYTINKTTDVIYVTYSERQSDGAAWRLAKKMTIDRFLEPFARGTSPTFDKIEPCTPQGLLWSQLLTDLEDARNSIGLILLKGDAPCGYRYAFPDISRIVRDLEFMRREWDGEELPCGPIFVPKIDLTMLSVVSEIITSKEFKEHIELRKEAK